MAVDTIIANGTVVTAETTFRGSVAVDDGTIVAVGDETSLPDASRTIDASGQLVMPGVVDPHVHIHDHSSLDTYRTATRAAALGGVTTLIDFAWQSYVDDDSPWDETETLREGIARKREKAADALVDFGYHGGIMREDGDIFEEMPDLVEEGITSFKMYTAYDYGLSTGFIGEVFDHLADLDAVGLVHTEDDSVCEALTERLRATGRTGPEWYPDSRPDYTEAMAADSVARLARAADAKYYGVHTTSRASADVIAAHQRDGSHVRAETCTHYTTLTDDLYAERGQVPLIAPPLRTDDDRDALFEYLREGVLSVVSSDHVAQTKADKTSGDWWEGPFGANSLQRTMPVFHDEAVNRRGLSYPFLVRVMCTNPAQTFGMPWKGTLEPGTDADVVLFDPSATRTIRAADNASTADYSLYEGREVTGAVTTTLVRGEPVVRDGEVVGTPGHGEFVARDVPDWSV
ncbi:MAG: dihydroorotase family protein [Haloplanus sp.]